MEAARGTLSNTTCGPLSVHQIVALFPIFEKRHGSADNLSSLDEDTDVETTMGLHDVCFEDAFHG